MTEVNPQAPSSQTEDAKKEHEEALGHEFAANSEAHNSRRGGSSKREIMEELSRQRFPWDE
ncbi:hypothetical protein [Polynucleobacter sp. JS-JIR-II-50]|uniref:hypothetical protein n=1 Tax=Polynucleobacter sp. JS-JIR-II-50 TaxID=2576919 RepID=UPI001BFD0E92|nr:hypothetical protein [Polynucleobacter sp. JS-JIR-II-50]QWE03934.1 hypothetical protein FD963_07270 [Polynucleobacter sp. JS-JIR-II-50]